MITTYWFSGLTSTMKCLVQWYFHYVIFRVPQFESHCYKAMQVVNIFRVMCQNAVTNFSGYILVFEICSRVQIISNFFQEEEDLLKKKNL